MLGELVDEPRKQKRLTVYTHSTDSDLAERLEDYDVVVEHERLPPAGPEPFVTIRDGETFAGALGLDAFDSLLEPPIVRPGSREGVSPGYRALFDALENTVLTTSDRRQLLGASREIEDRAFRVGSGTLRVSFQRLSVFESQAAVYRHLASETDLDVHIYGVADWSPPEIEGVTYHATEGVAVEEYWALAFDGGDDERQACGLVARETDGEYRGIWTYDRETVDTILATLEAVGG